MQNGNGVSKVGDAVATTDLRSVRTGTLVYNLVLATISEQAMSIHLRQIEQVRKSQNLVGKTPQQEQLEEGFAKVQVERYKLANEMNARFSEHDGIRAEKFGLEIGEQVTDGQAGVDDAS